MAGWMSLIAVSKAISKAPNANSLDVLDRTWYHLRTPQKPYHSLTDRPGSLALRGNGYSISDVEAPAMILKKQTHLTGVWTVELDFDPSTENEEAGTAVFWSCFAYAAIVVRKGLNGNERTVVLRWTDPDCDEYKVSALFGESSPADDARNLKSQRLSPPLDQLRFEYPLSQHHILCRIRLVKMTTQLI